MSVVLDSSKPIVACPYCKAPVIIEQINCGIFRHGIRKADGKPMDPHAPKDVCDRLIKDNAIYGCGKPFQTVFDVSGSLIAIACDYI